jgi:hypothetical protein
MFIPSIILTDLLFSSFFGEIKKFFKENGEGEGDAALEYFT